MWKKFLSGWVTTRLSARQDLAELVQKIQIYAIFSVMGNPQEKPVATTAKKPEEKGQETFTDKFGILRSTDEPLMDAKKARFVLKRIIDSPQLSLFLEMSEEDLKAVKRSADIIEKNYYGSNITINREDLEKYEAAITKLKRCYTGSPRFISTSKENPNEMFLCTPNSEELRGVKRGDSWFIVSTLQIPQNISEEMLQERIAILKRFEYFPKILIFEEQGKKRIGIEFIASSIHPERGTDISDFYKICQEIDFGADTNFGNFLRDAHGKLKYIDRDIAEWIIDPTQNRFIEKLTTKVVL